MNDQAATQTKSKMLSVKFRQNYKLLQNAILTVSYISDYDKDQIDKFDIEMFYTAIDNLFISLDKFEKSFKSEMERLDIQIEGEQ